MGEVTRLLREAATGGASAQSRAIEAVYGELHRLARARLQGGPMTLLDATSLVHEFYLRLQSAGELDFRDRRHFFAYASRAMRSIVVDHARERLAQRRGAGSPHVALDTHLEEVIAAPGPDVLGVHAALEELGQVDERLASVVEMRYFGGFEEAEIADALGLTERTVQRDWRKARMVLAAIVRQETKA